MAESIGIVASVISVAGLAYSSAQLLYQTISGIKNAPKTIVDLKTDLGILYKTIHSLQQNLEVKTTDTKFSEAQESNLREIKPTLDACRVACDAFQAKIHQLLRHSTDDHVGVRDRLKVQFQEKEIVAFQARLSSYKATLAIALEFSSFKTASKNLDATKNLETKIEDATAHLTGQMQGLQIGLQAILDAGSEGEELIGADRQFHLNEAQQSEALAAIEKQNITLSHCYRACMAALQETTKATGHDYKYVKAFKEARLLMGNLGNVQGAASHKFRHIEVEGGWVVAGDMHGDSAEYFFKRD